MSSHSLKDRFSRSFAPEDSDSSASLSSTPYLYQNHFFKNKSNKDEPKHLTHSVNHILKKLLGKDILKTIRTSSEPETKAFETSVRQAVMAIFTSSMSSDLTDIENAFSKVLSFSRFREDESLQSTYYPDYVFQTALKQKDPKVSRAPTHHLNDFFVNQSGSNELTALEESLTDSKHIFDLCTLALVIIDTQSFPASHVFTAEDVALLQHAQPTVFRGIEAGHAVSKFVEGIHSLSHRHKQHIQDFQNSLFLVDRLDHRIHKKGVKPGTQTFAEWASDKAKSHAHLHHYIQYLEERHSGPSLHDLSNETFRRTKANKISQKVISLLSAKHEGLEKYRDHLADPSNFQALCTEIKKFKVKSDRDLPLFNDFLSTIDSFSAFLTRQRSTSSTFLKGIKKLSPRSAKFEGYFNDYLKEVETKRLKFQDPHCDEVETASTTSSTDSMTSTPLLSSTPPDSPQSVSVSLSDLDARSSFALGPAACSKSSRTDFSFSRPITPSF